MMTCRFCGGQSESIALSTKIVTNRKGERDLADLPEQVYDPDPCKECMEKFNGGYRYFIGNCGHSGFVKEEVLPRIFNEEGMKMLGASKVFRMEKCFHCLGFREKQGGEEAAS